MKKYKKLIAGKLFYIILFLLLAISIGHTIYERIVLFQDHSYTIATTLSSSPRGRKRVFDYKYYVNGKGYFGREDDNGYVIIPNGKYYVKYSTTKPHINKILLDSAVIEK